ncbi:hypothetical protein [Massilia oculi]|uniref:hypothetical protein n=1 Tax=Massilia oculi TaxID=945844 RepID=UPI001AAE1B78|nr:hypothetical protein [Massilia oculi]
MNAPRPLVDFDALRATGARLLDAFARHAQRAGVGSVEARLADDLPVASLQLQARCADLVARSQDAPFSANLLPGRRHLPEQLVVRCPRPILVVPAGYPLARRRTDQHQRQPWTAGRRGRMHQRRHRPEPGPLARCRVQRQAARRPERGRRVLLCPERRRDRQHGARRLRGLRPDYRRGVELDLRYQFSSAFSTYLNHGRILRAQLDNPDPGAGDRLSVPEHTWKAGAQ